ncbi:MAG: CbbQ/NirQ/NorQ/GpvN family protein [Polyangiales bacterium]
MPSSALKGAPYYKEQFDECAVFELAHRRRLPLMLKGPTGCGKTRFIEAMAHRLGRELITVACNDDTSATDLLGRFLVKGGDTVWQDGPVTRAVRRGAILYLDEIAEAREDVVVVLHPLTDHRRELHVDRINETLSAPNEFMVVVSFNPGYRRGFRELKASTRQRFLGIDFGYPNEAVELEIVVNESGVEGATAKKLVTLATKIRALDELNLTETVSTRLLVQTATLIAEGMAPRRACQVGLVAPLTDDALLSQALKDVVAFAF